MHSRALLTLLACLAPSAALAAPRTVLVLPFVAENNIKENVLNGLHEVYVGEAAKLSGVAMGELTARALQMNSECLGDPPCLGKGLARLGNAQFVLTTVEKGDKGGYRLNQTLHDAPGGAQVAAVTTLMKGKSDQLEKQALRAATELLAPHLLTGGIKVDVNVAGAEVFVDGKRLGKAPLPSPLGGLAEGHHKVRVERTDHQPFETEVVVAFGEVSELDVRLTREFKAEYKPDVVSKARASRGFPLMGAVVPAVGAGAAVVAVGALLVVTGGLAGGTFYAARVLEDRALKGTLIFPKDQGLLWTWRVLAVSTLVALAITAVSGLGITAATAVATAVVWGLHFAKPLPEDDTYFSDPSLRKKTVERAPPSDDGEAAPEPPRPAPPPKKPARKKTSQQTEDNLPEGE
jgi:hypothetical protein